ncbi:LLM class flavin-dependent oxidoreductase [Corynebacterium sp. sy017]|uniref:NtaA/DmoA family FMN-dependent monooxygenase n=1 Tax=unclassified Corynebacterium TaxID=2624378 RepID=UPI00118656E3|nr:MULTISPECIES: NtaA/DmoA family FMN-dependent monooxygenase [unclassified Corynebacterium]MBP3089124.1 LLM class flavin-dependent oxidoreductase [Corynebacterium sp. sy017]QDZ42482.1 NtaA/DmoA family FMN-dependent monooxygenase [Corynebacterium sp. sy039]TSD91438.1 LLM class flavin-dependent oxidoreductase [Corynebacterium sp. SY003]
MSNNTQKKMIIGMQLGNGYGSQVTAWNFDGVDPHNYSNVDSHVRYAQKAERGKFQFIFFPDSPNQTMGSDKEAPQMTMDPLITMAAIARGTSKIGLASTASTQWNEPYNLARQLKTLDVISGGRIGWNAVTGSDPRGAANFGQNMESSAHRYGRLHEFVQIVQALWGSWEKDALVLDKEKGIFARRDKIRPINMAGEFLASAGPLPIPPSPQGQPVIFQAGGSPNGLQVAGRYANAVIGATFSIEDSIRQRNAVRKAAEDAGRNPDEIKFFAGVMPTIAPTKREALDRRGKFVEPNILQRVNYLGAMLGITLTRKDLDSPIDPAVLKNAHAHPGDPRSAKALEIARQGWSVRDILYHGIIDFHPSPVGTAEEVADHLTEWFEAGAVDGFWYSPDAYEDGIDAFVDNVVPILQERGLFHTDYEGSTLREHLGAPEQYGLDPRIQ